MRSLFRWILMVPTGALAGLLILFPLRWSLYMTLTGSGLVTPYPAFLEELFSPFASFCAFQYTLVAIAPHYKQITGSIFVVLHTVLALSFVTYLAIISGGSMAVGHYILTIDSFQTFSVFGGIIGSVVGCYLGNKRAYAQTQQD